jgi:hypothetical protein
MDNNGASGVMTDVDNINSLAQELSLAVEITMDNNSSQQARMEAYHACER